MESGVVIYSDQGYYTPQVSGSFTMRNIPMRSVLISVLLWASIVLFFGILVFSISSRFYRREWCHHVSFRACADNDAPLPHGHFYIEGVQYTDIPGSLSQQTAGFFLEIIMGNTRWEQEAKRRIQQEIALSGIPEEMTKEEVAFLAQFRESFSDNPSPTR